MSTPPLSALEELACLLRPAGGGVHTVSTGRGAQATLQAALYGAADADQTHRRWRDNLERIARARVAILAIPSDCGAGLVRGASFGPQALRLGLLRDRPDLLRDETGAVVDVGDVAVIPHLLSDDMLNDAQIASCRAALYGEMPAARDVDLPVSPLSIAERALDRIFDLNPDIKLLVMGGDHSVAWPVAVALKRRRANDLGIVQPDAHTDLLPHRLGVRICFATWAYHANELIGRGGRLVQVGVRASARSRAHWETTQQVRQFWNVDVEQRGEAAVLDDIVDHLRQCGVRQLYFSNDIDATDLAQAPATGAPEPGGLRPEFVTKLIARLGAAFDLVAADLVEVAPPVGSREDSEKTVAVGVAYLTASLEALLGRAA